MPDNRVQDGGSAFDARNSIARLRLGADQNSRAPHAPRPVGSETGSRKPNPSPCGGRSLDSGVLDAGNSNRISPLANRHLRPPEYDSRNSWKPGWVIFKQWWRCITPVSQPLNSSIANAPGNGSNVNEIGKHKHTCKSWNNIPSDERAIAGVTTPPTFVGSRYRPGKGPVPQRQPDQWLVQNNRLRG